MPPTRRPAAERFWPKVDKRGPNECWPWLGWLNTFGYGSFSMSPEREMPAHRAAYELLVGPIPEGLQIDHVCHSRDLACAGGWHDPHKACVNPRHLEPVTHAENMARTSGHPRRRSSW